MKKLVNWLIRDSIDVRYRVLNIILASTFAMMIPAIIMTACYDRGFFTLIMPCAEFLVISFCIWLSNFKNHFKAASALFCVVTCFIILPITYFWDGGKRSGEPYWLIGGLLLIFITMEGKTAIAFSIIDVAIIGACFYLESSYPYLVTYIGSDKAEAIDIFLSLVFVCMGIGAILKFQTYMYQKQTKFLEEKEVELTEAIAEVEKANQAKSDFLANMSHEIRTPINAVLGMNEMILRESKEENISTYATGIENAGQTLLSLINDILDFSKIESGKMDIIPTEYELYSLMNDAYNMVSSRAAGKKLNLVIKNNEKIPSKLFGDEIRLRQILINLLTNAIKYTSVGTITLNIDYAERGRDSIYLILTVSDTGAGIKKEDMDKLFNQFERVDTKKNRSIEGTGLGLAITKRFVDLMGGEISVDSEYGNGSSFIVRVPQGVIENEPMGSVSNKLSSRADEVHEYHESFRAPKARILSVDDVKMNQDVLCMLLKQTGVNIDCVYSGRECLNMLRASKYDLILMDHMMPEMDGVETFRRIQELEGNPNINTPVIVLTANAIAGAEEGYLKEGFVDYISKPVKGPDLEKTIKKHLPKHLLEEDVNLEPEGETVKKSLSLQDVFSFLDTAYGIECCGDSQEFYLSALESYVSTDNRSKALNEAFKMEQWEEYKVNAHAVKSSSLLVGAMELSQLAKTFEFAARDNDLNYIKANHEEFLNQYDLLLSQIREKLKEM